MKKLFVALLVVGLLGVFTLPALAQIDQDLEGCDLAFDVDVLKDKTITIDKIVNKTIDYNIDVTIWDDDLRLTTFPGLAEVEAFKCDKNQDNNVTVQRIGSVDNIFDAFKAFSGIAQFNQASGMLNNQGNMVALGFTDSPIETHGLSLVEAAVQKRNGDNTITVQRDIPVAEIYDAFKAFSGIAQFNQSPGLLNNQNNVVALGVNFNATGLVAENDSFLAMQNSDNTATVETYQPTANIFDAFNAFSGIAQVNQSPGTMNNQANIVSIAYGGR